MPAARIPTKKKIEVVCLKHAAKLSHDKIARACGLSKGVVGKYVSATQALGLTWPLPEGYCHDLSPAGTPVRLRVLLGVEGPLSI